MSEPSLGAEIFNGWVFHGGFHCHLHTGTYSFSEHMLHVLLAAYLREKKHFHKTGPPLKNELPMSSCTNAPESIAIIKKLRGISGVKNNVLLFRCSIQLITADLEKTEFVSFSRPTTVFFH